MTLVADLEAIVGSERLKTHPLELLLFGRDAGVGSGEAAAVVFPPAIP